MENSREYLYRYVETRYSLGVDQFDEPLPGYKLVIHLDKFLIHKRTPKGAWIELYPSYLIDDNLDWREGKKFVLLTAHKKFACETKEEAMESFIARKRRQIRILKRSLRQAEEALNLTESSKKYEGFNLSRTIPSWELKV